MHQENKNWKIWSRLLTQIACAYACCLIFRLAKEDLKLKHLIFCIWFFTLGSLLSFTLIFSWIVKGLKNRSPKSIFLTLVYLAFPYKDYKRNIYIYCKYIYIYFFNTYRWNFTPLNPLRWLRLRELNGTQKRM